MYIYIYTYIYIYIALLQWGPSATKKNCKLSVLDDQMVSKRLKICRHAHYTYMSMPANFQPFWKPFCHPKQGNTFGWPLYLSEKCFLVLDDQMVFKMAENLQAYSYMYNEYAYKFSVILETIWSSEWKEVRNFFSCGWSSLEKLYIYIYAPSRSRWYHIHYIEKTFLWDSLPDHIYIIITVKF